MSHKARVLLDISMPEKVWMQQVLDLARLCGWIAYHPYDSRRSTPGYPDLHLVRPPRSIFIETKREYGKLTPQQQHWLDLLRACGYEVYVWRPSDWNEVVETLR